MGKSSGQASPTVSNMQAAMASAERIFQLLDDKATVVDAPDSGP